MERTVTHDQFIAHIREMQDGRTNEPCVAIFESTHTVDRRTGTDYGPASFSLFRDGPSPYYTEAQLDEMFARSGSGNRHSPTMNNSLNGERGSFLKEHRNHLNKLENDIDVVLLPLLRRMEGEGPITYIIGRHYDPKGMSYYVEGDTP